MKNLNKIALILSFIVVLIAFSVLSMSSLPAEYRYTWMGLNPLRGMEGLAFTVQYFLHTGAVLTWTITIALILLIWWRLYAIFNRI
ncbi:hypothetical protein [Odoribacter lunatus]|uniref:hypothetical protein n=1 Tax=Odoribacter lunatus TaxID=2941335 RepID=UPI00204231E0|nr:hypothetical protein [Odoribacter lunatus]